MRTRTRRRERRSPRPEEPLSEDGSALVHLREPPGGTPPLVDTPEALAVTLGRLRAGRGPFALDTERAAGFRYSQRAYLVQVRREGAGTHLIDPVAFADFTELGEVLAADEWILHAATQDLPCLRGLGLAPTALFDTELAGRLLGHPRVGLGTMVLEELGVSLRKEHSAADWSTRPLPTSWLNYAALDVEFLVGLRDVLARKLRASGRAEWARQEFAAVAAAPDPVPHPEPWRRTSHITDVRTGRGLAVVRELWRARDRIARRIDLAPGRVLSERVIVAVASAHPLPPELPPLRELRRHAEEWRAAYAHALSLRDAQLPPRRGPGRAGLPEPRQWYRLNPPAAARLEAVKLAVRGLAAELGLPQENLLAPAAQRTLAWSLTSRWPGEAADILRQAGAREWQVELVVEPVLATIANPPVSEDLEQALP